MLTDIGCNEQISNSSSVLFLIGNEYMEKNLIIQFKPILYHFVMMAPSS